MTNQDCQPYAESSIERANIVIQAHINNVKCYEPVDYFNTILADILTDLMHHCDSTGTDFEQVLRDATMAYGFEKG